MEWASFLFFSITSKSSFSEIGDLREQIVRVKETENVDTRKGQQEQPQKTPIIVVGNKCDLEDQRLIPRKEAESLCKNINAEYIEASARTNTNIEEIFHSLVRQIVSQMPNQIKKNKKCVIL